MAKRLLYRPGMRTQGCIFVVLAVISFLFIYVTSAEHENFQDLYADLLRLEKTLLNNAAATLASSPLHDEHSGKKHENIEDDDDEDDDEDGEEDGEENVDSEPRQDTKVDDKNDPGVVPNRKFVEHTANFNSTSAPLDTPSSKTTPMQQGEVPHPLSVIGDEAFLLFISPMQDMDFPACVRYVSAQLLSETGGSFTFALPFLKEVVEKVSTLVISFYELLLVFTTDPEKRSTFAKKIAELLESMGSYNSATISPSYLETDLSNAIDTDALSLKVSLPDLIILSKLIDSVYSILGNLSLKAFSENLSRVYEARATDTFQPPKALLHFCDGYVWGLRKSIELVDYVLESLQNLSNALEERGLELIHLDPSTMSTTYLVSLAKHPSKPESESAKDTAAPSKAGQEVKNVNTGDIHNNDVPPSPNGAKQETENDENDDKAGKTDNDNGKPSPSSADVNPQDSIDPVVLEGLPKRYLQLVLGELENKRTRARGVRETLRSNFDIVKLTSSSVYGVFVSSIATILVIFVMC